jgi:hypothetical protein
MAKLGRAVKTIIKTKEKRKNGRVDEVCYTTLLVPCLEITIENTRTNGSTHLSQIAFTSP